jgi:hypothetical protein
MTSPNSTFTEMVTTTARNHGRELTDNISNNNGFFNRLKTKGKIQNESGGYEIARPLEYAENSTFQRYSGYDMLSTEASDVMTAAKYDWAQSAIHVTASGREIRMNNGPERMINLVKARIRNAMHTAANNMSVDIYSDGSLSNQIGGLGLVLQTGGTGTLGGINSSTYTFWQHKYKEAAGTNTWSKSTIKGEMNNVWLQTVRGQDKPDLIIMSNDFYSAYEESLQDNQRYMDSRSASAGFEMLKYKTADVMFDSNTNFGTTAEKAFFLNTDYLYLIQHPDAQWTQDDEKRPTNQDAVVVPLYWMGQLITTNRSLQGYLYDAA